MKKSLAPQLALLALLLLPAAPLCAQELASQGNRAAAVGQTETEKTGDYSSQWQPSWSALSDRLIVVNPALVLTALLAVFLALGLIATLRMIFATGRQNVSPKTKRATTKRKRGVRRWGLRFKLTLFAIALAVLVSGMVYVPVSYMTYKTQQETLMNSLWDRCAVLLDNIFQSVYVYLPAGNVTALGLLPARAAVIPEAQYLTITGITPGSSVYDDCVWATNDPDILLKIDTRELRQGISRLNDSLSPRMEQMRRELNARAEATVAALSQNANGAALEAAIAQAFLEMTRFPGCEPEFMYDNSADGNRHFILFRPIMYRNGTSANYFQGLIRLEVSADAIAAQLRDARSQLLQTTLYIALSALILGILGAFELSSLIVRPIQKLVRHVETIRDAEDMEKLADANIYITSRDEIATLGDTINEMTQGLVKAAGAAKDLSIGREIQKKFLPLEIDQNGNKLSSGYMDTKRAIFFGYYEGARGISGDYFDYKNLDGRYYAIIKCDIAGKGLPAALLMIQVATMFLTYFKDWEPHGKGMRIEEAVYQINSFIETLGFKGSFAAFSLCLFDSETGDLHFCNAGDNIIHICDTSEKCVKSITLPTTPAAGALPNSMVEAMGGYQVQTITLDHNDILLLYTDGIEESKRIFYDAPSHGEEMGAQRVQDIINAVLNQTTYVLKKRRNHEEEEREELVFDYSRCEGNVEEVVMALISAEKMFRCYQHPLATENDRVPVDKKVDAFLKKHFQQYESYCTRTLEHLGDDSYMYYTYLRESEQYDDLSILGVKRK